MRMHTTYRTFETATRQEIIDITDDVEASGAAARIADGMVLSGPGEDNAAAHLRSLTLGHEVIVPVTGGALDLGPWQRVFCGEWDGQRPKRVVYKAMGI